MGERRRGGKSKERDIAAYTDSPCHQPCLGQLTFPYLTLPVDQPRDDTSDRAKVGSGPLDMNLYHQWVSERPFQAESSLLAALWGR